MWNFDVTEIEAIRVRSALKFGDREISALFLSFFLPFEETELGHDEALIPNHGLLGHDEA